MAEGCFAKTFGFLSTGLPILLLGYLVVVDLNIRFDSESAKMSTAVYLTVLGYLLVHGVVCWMLSSRVKARDRWLTSALVVCLLLVLFLATFSSLFRGKTTVREYYGTNRLKMRLCTLERKCGVDVGQWRPVVQQQQLTPPPHLLQRGVVLVGGGVEVESLWNERLSRWDESTVKDTCQIMVTLEYSQPGPLAAPWEQGIYFHHAWLEPRGSHAHARSRWKGVFAAGYSGDASPPSKDALYLGITRGQSGGAQGVEDRGRKLPGGVLPATLSGDLLQASELSCSFSEQSARTRETSNSRTSGGPGGGPSASATTSDSIATKNDPKPFIEARTGLPATEILFPHFQVPGDHSTSTHVSLGNITHFLVNMHRDTALILFINGMGIQILLLWLIFRLYRCKQENGSLEKGFGRKLLSSQKCVLLGGMWTGLQGLGALFFLCGLITTPREEYEDFSNRPWHEGGFSSNNKKGPDHEDGSEDWNLPLASFSKKKGGRQQETCFASNVAGTQEDESADLLQVDVVGRITTPCSRSDTSEQGTNVDHRDGDTPDSSPRRAEVDLRGDESPASTRQNTALRLASRAPDLSVHRRREAAKIQKQDAQEKGGSDIRRNSQQLEEKGWQVSME